MRLIESPGKQSFGVERNRMAACVTVYVIFFESKSLDDTDAIPNHLAMEYVPEGKVLSGCPQGLL
jgi:hypothetical protein